MKQIRYHGKFRSKPQTLGLKVMFLTMAMGFVIKTAYDPNIIYRPLVGQVEAKEVVQTIVIVPVTIEDKIRAMFPEDPDRAVAIAKCESGMRANAFNGKNTNGSFDSGLYQINSVHGYSKEKLFDVDFNLKIARKLYDRNGWGDWYSSKHCWSKYSK
jgi:hypothetical protein